MEPVNFLFVFMHYLYPRRNGSGTYHVAPYTDSAFAFRVFVVRYYSQARRTQLGKLFQLELLYPLPPLPRIRELFFKPELTVYLNKPSFAPAKISPSGGVYSSASQISSNISYFCVFSSYAQN